MKDNAATAEHLAKIELIKLLDIKLIAIATEVSAVLYTKPHGPTARKLQISRLR